MPCLDQRPRSMIYFSFPLRTDLMYSGAKCIPLLQVNTAQRSRWIMPKRKQKKERLSVSVTEEQKAALQAIADKSDVSLARVVQEAVKEFLAKHNEQRLPLFDRPPPKG
jgi:hypothetical protein